MQGGGVFSTAFGGFAETFYFGHPKHPDKGSEEDALSVARIW